MWLLRTAWTLEKYGVHADAKLLFMPQHKPLRIHLPSGITLRLRACFSNPVLQTVMGICSMLSESQLLLFFLICSQMHYHCLSPTHKQHCSVTKKLLITLQGFPKKKCECNLLLWSQKYYHCTRVSIVFSHLYHNLFCITVNCKLTPQVKLKTVSDCAVFKKPVRFLFS